MSRTADWSLKYFPLDSGFFEDKRIRRLRSKFGADGPMLYLYILCHAYGGEGYYLPYSEDWVEDAAEDLGCSADKIGLMLHYLLDKTLLDSTLFSTVKVLSSHGIQAQYQRSKKACKQDIEVDGRLWVLSESETAGFIKVRLFPDSSQKQSFNSEKKALNSEKKATKERKENKSTLNERKGKLAHEAQTAQAFPPTLEDVCKYNAEIGGDADPVKFFERYERCGWLYQGEPMDWQAKLREWNRTERPGKRRVTSAAEYKASKESGSEMKKFIGIALERAWVTEDDVAALGERAASHCYQLYLDRVMELI